MSSTAREVFDALTSGTGLLQPKWLYDDTGSLLYEAITELPEYYPTRVELGILRDHSPDIARLTGATHITELGSGASPKTIAMIRGFISHGLLESFTAFDVNADAAERSVSELRSLFPDLEFVAEHGDFNDGIPLASTQGPRVLAFLGSTIGNFLPDQRRRFLTVMHDSLRPGDWLLLGLDLVKDPARILAAYDDSQGLTARFISNVLNNINAVAGSDFDPTEFKYVPSWNADDQRVEMRLCSNGTQQVRLADSRLQLAAGEEILVEVSTKFELHAMVEELGSVGLSVDHQFTGADAGRPEPDFALLVARRPLERLP